MKSEVARLQAELIEADLVRPMDLSHAAWERRQKTIAELKEHLSCSERRTKNGQEGT